MGRGIVVTAGGCWRGGGNDTHCGLSIYNLVCARQDGRANLRLTRRVGVPRPVLCTAALLLILRCAALRVVPIHRDDPDGACITH